jgi:hypothetical protein
MEEWSIMRSVTGGIMLVCAPALWNGLNLSNLHSPAMNIFLFIAYLVFMASNLISVLSEWLS